MPKRFTLVEATSLLPQISQLLREAVELKSQYQEAEQRLHEQLQRIMMMGGMVVDRELVGASKAERERCAGRLKSALEGIQETGCLVKDLDTGLIDFPTLFRGREVYLCWRLGEQEIQFWHGVEEGFAGRKPIDRDFLDHHEGDRTH